MHSGNRVTPTPPSGDSSDRIANTQFVTNAITSNATTNFTTLTVNGNNVLTVIGNQVLSGGFNELPFSLGIATSGSPTITPNPSNNLKQVLINNGTCTIGTTSQVGDVELYITNGTTPGPVTFSNFTKQFPGDSLDQTTGHEFVVFIWGFQNEAGANKSAYVIKAMQ